MLLPTEHCGPVDLVLRFELGLATLCVLSCCSQLTERDDLVLKVSSSVSSELDQEMK